IGGTQESARLAAALWEMNLPCTISITTESARTLYPDTPRLQVWVGRLTAKGVEEFLQQQQIVAILDASHPFAGEISNRAITAAAELRIPYLRYERPMVDTQHFASRNVVQLDGFATLIAGNYLNSQRVLLTVGYQPLHLFRQKQDQATLFARILPSAIALTAAEAAGFTSDRLICLRPPIHADLERILWQQWEISLVVTKASGVPGGEDVKRTVAAELGIPLVTINRPFIAYPQQTSDLSVALKFCRRHCNQNA
ncbi:MAG: cobalt-precorrin-6A reductase, partial [Chroococcidiopsidaceae cyanobacterium CP_BM_RX_35]|nr:cobalt-precorrin-6A reductase [Chroococcidiopsidaceae cyanobacterium CP_BM_RX_35]